MKVLHVITGLGDGGAEAVLCRLIENDDGNEHFVVSLTSEGKYGALLRERGVNVVVLSMPRGRATVRGLWQLWRHLRSVRPNVVQTWMYHADLLGGVAARLAGVPVVWGIRHTTLDPARSSRLTIAVARVCAWLSRLVPRRIVACAQSALRVHGALGYDAQRMVVIPNGYDVKRFCPDQEARRRLRAEWGVAPDVPLIGMVARWDPCKDHAVLVQALVQLRERGVRFDAILVGHGVDPSNTVLREWVDRCDLQGRVRLLGPRGDIPAVMSVLDVHVLSSLAEAFPNVLAEAMACGTPCVTTDVGDAAIIVGKMGWVVPPKNSEALADALQDALEAMASQGSWLERKKACRARIAEHFSIESMVRRYVAVWEETQQASVKGGRRCAV